MILLAALVSAHPAHAIMGDLEADVAFGQADDVERSVGHPLGAASFAEPRGIAIDRSVTPNRVYVSDSVYSRVLGWANVDSLTDGAPADLIIGQSDFGAAGCNQRRASTGIIPSATAADLCEPAGLAVDNQGNLFVADARNCRVAIFRDPFATDGLADAVLGTSNYCGLAREYLNHPTDVAIESSGNVLVTDKSNCRVLGYDDPLNGGDGVADRVFGQPDFESRSCSTIYHPTGIAIGPTGAFFVATARRVLQYDDASRSVEPPTRRLGTAHCNRSCFSCTAVETASTTCVPLGLAVADNGRLYVADGGNERVLGYANAVTDTAADLVLGRPDFSGDGRWAEGCPSEGPLPTNLCFWRLTSSEVTETRAIIRGAALDVDAGGRLYVADTLHHRVVRYDEPAAVSSAELVLGQPGLELGAKPAAILGDPHVEIFASPGLIIATGTSIAVDAEASRILIYQRFNPFWVADMPIGVIGQPDFESIGCNNGGRSSASLCAPTGAAIDSAGNLWVADTGNDRVLRFDAPWFRWDDLALDWVIKTTADAVLGQPDFSSSGCVTGATGLCAPTGVAGDASGGLFISDTGNNRVVYHANPSVDGVADGVLGQQNLDGTGCNAAGIGPSSLCGPRGIHLAGSGDLFVADSANHRVLVFDVGQSPPWTATKVFGQGGSFTGADCSAGPGGLCVPVDVAMGLTGDLFVADSENNRVLQFDGPLDDTDADRVLGQPDMLATSCETGSSGLCHPTTVAVGTSHAIQFGLGGESVLVGDDGNNRVVGYAAPYCLVDYRSDLAIDGVSGPRKSRLKLSRRRGAGEHFLRFVHKQATAFFLSVFNSPLFRISAISGTAYERRLPYVSNTSLSNRRATYRSSTPKMMVREVWGSGRQELTYRGKFEGLDLSGFDAASATLRFQFGSTCVTSDLRCRHRARSSRCVSLP